MIKSLGRYGLSSVLFRDNWWSVLILKADLNCFVFCFWVCCFCDAGDDEVLQKISRKDLFQKLYKRRVNGISHNTSILSTFIISRSFGVDRKMNNNL